MKRRKYISSFCENKTTPKGCWFNKFTTSRSSLNTKKLKRLSSEFDYTAPIAKKITRCLDTYNFHDAVIAIFCLNS